MHKGLGFGGSTNHLAPMLQGSFTSKHKQVSWSAQCWLPLNQQLAAPAAQSEAQGTDSEVYTKTSEKGTGLQLMLMEFCMEKKSGTKRNGKTNKQTKHTQPVRPPSTHSSYSTQLCTTHTAPRQVPSTLPLQPHHLNYQHLHFWLSKKPLLHSASPLK